MTDLHLVKRAEGDMRATAWAKVNLALHVRTRRADGYHEIETLFAFVDGGDALTARVADQDALTVEGPFAEGLEAGEDNLVLRALRLLRQHFGEERVPPLALRLEKNLPVAAGIGGGSADAAALARLVRAHFLPDLSDGALASLVGALGADIAACVASRSCLGTGTGATLAPLPGAGVGGIPILLVNPRQRVATGPVFAAWDGIDRGPLYIGSDLRAELIGARNDLQRPATAECPAIADVLLELGALGPWLARMSGSGATCFALFDALAQRDAAAAELARTRPDWWQLKGVLR